MNIQRIEIDDYNIDHLRRHGVTLQEVVNAFEHGRFFRNRNRRTANFFVLDDHVRVNFIYKNGTARPISAWRL